jgi:hypothetical protein
MTRTRNGKIARLPREIRDQLNRRLNNGEPGVRLVEWLNSLPEVQQVLQAEFDGRPVNNQNLSDWTAGGYRDWQARQEILAQARELAADATELNGATDGRLTDHLATVLAARYAAALAGWDGEFTDEFRRTLRTLSCLCQDVVELRRGDHSGLRLGMERERLERERERTEEEVLEHFERWAKNPQVRDCICSACRNRPSPEEIRRRLDEIYGLAPDKPDKAAPDRPEERPRQIREVFGLPPEEGGGEPTDAAGGPVNGQEQGEIKPNQA